MTEKYDYKSEPGYKALKKPQLLTLGAQKFIAIHGLGDPNTEPFALRIQALYAVSYTIRMSQKNNFAIPGFFEYTVYPLEGRWSIQDKYVGQPLQKSHFEYEIMIKQPDFVTPDIFAEAVRRADEGGKIPDGLAAQLKFIDVTEGAVAQILHIGSFDDEPASFAKLADFLESQGLQRTEYEHKEIYLSDFRRVAEEKRKTLLRVRVAKK